jgi:soluble lytic murein transglycosylase
MWVSTSFADIAQPFHTRLLTSCNAQTTEIMQAHSDHSEITLQQRALEKQALHQGNDQRESKPALPISSWRMISQHVLSVFYAAAVSISMTLGNFSAAAAGKVAPNEPRATSAGAIDTPPILNVTNPAALSVDREIVAARAAFERRDVAALQAARAAASTSGHPLLPYLDFWWFTLNLSRPNAPGSGAIFAVARSNEIAAFLDANQETPFADSLRRDWLRILGSLDEWDEFEPEFAKLTTDDSDVTCHQWRYLLTRNTPAEAISKPQIKSAWLSGKYSTENCYAAFQLAFDAGIITSDNVWPRVRRAFEANQLVDARRSAAFSKSFAPSSTIFDRTVSAAAADPAKYLDAQKVVAKSASSTEVFLFALTRLAKSDAPRAAILLEQHGGSQTLSKADLSYAWAQVGQYGAMQHDTNALAWFRKAASVAATELNDAQAGWKARAALRAGDWDQVSLAIDAMSVAERRDSAWRYWQARAYAQAGNVEAAKPIRAMLARENSFYGVLASEELGTPITPNWQGHKPTRIELDRLLSLAGIRRALALYRLDMKPEGIREWYYATRNMNDQDLLAAAEIARQANIPDRAINAADRTSVVHDFTQRFPMPHRADMQAQAKSNQLDEAWMYGLIRQESRFMADARSRVGAMGLMQLMPATAKWAANRVGMKNLMMDRVVDVPVNLSLGAYYLRHVLDDLGHPVLATAGYNAGPGRARRWRAETPLEGAIYAESIPFTETRDYVKKVMANAWFYARQMGSAKSSLKEMMGNVPSRGGAGGMGSATSGIWGGSNGVVDSARDGDKRNEKDAPAAGTVTSVEPATAVLNSVSRTE